MVKFEDENAVLSTENLKKLVGAARESDLSGNTDFLKLWTYLMNPETDERNHPYRAFGRMTGIRPRIVPTMTKFKVGHRVRAPGFNVGTAITEPTEGTIVAKNANEAGDSYYVRLDNSLGGIYYPDEIEAIDE